MNKLNINLCKQLKIEFQSFFFIFLYYNTVVTEKELEVDRLKSFTITTLQGTCTKILFIRNLQRFCSLVMQIILEYLNIYQ